ncbi:MAG TPA: hypothetical protein VM056_02005 [Terriglobales bacterium]|nr:hypothetical protein [Terriglobales bacterium]
MTMKKQWLVVITAVFAMMLSASAQQKEEAVQKNLRAYRVDYSLVETQDGKKVNTRNYTVLVEEEERGNYSPASIRVGTRVPITAANKDGQPTMQYMDVGLNIDCRIKPRGADKASVESTIEIANFISDDQVRSSTPVLRSNKSRVIALVTLGKRTTVATYDDINSTRSTAVEITVTQL